MQACTRAGMVVHEQRDGHTRTTMGMTPPQSDHFQEQLAVVEQRATTAEATTAQLMSEKQADATRYDGAM